MQCKKRQMQRRVCWFSNKLTLLTNKNLNFFLIASHTRTILPSYPNPRYKSIFLLIVWPVVWFSYVTFQTSILTTLVFGEFNFWKYSWRKSMLILHPKFRTWLKSFPVPIGIGTKTQLEREGSFCSSKSTILFIEPSPPHITIINFSPLLSEFKCDFKKSNTVGSKRLIALSSRWSSFKIWISLNPNFWPLLGLIKNIHLGLNSLMLLLKNRNTKFLMRFGNATKRMEKGKTIHFRIFFEMLFCLNIVVN